MKYIKDRAKEVSSFSGVIFLLSLVGISVAPEHMEIVPQAFAVGAGLLELFRKEK